MSRHRHAPTFATFADSTLAARLRAQVRFAAREARRDPRGFVRSLVASDPLDRRSRRELWSIRLGIPAASSSGFALGVLVYATLFGAPQEAIAQTEENPVPPVLVAVAPPREPGPPMPRDPGTLGGGVVCVKFCNKVGGSPPEHRIG